MLGLHQSGGIYNGIYEGGIFIVIAYICSEIQELSWTLFHTFVLKENHGFNKMTLRLFIADKFKGIALAFLLGVPIYYGFMTMIEQGGEQFYIYLFGFSAVTIMIMVNVIPNFIMPLFNEYKDLEDGPLRERIVEIAERLKFPLKKIFVVDASKRSSHSNAYYFGFGSNKRIVLFDTLLEQHTGPDGIEEILGVVKHELGHWYYMHPLIFILVNFTTLGIMFVLFSFTINNHQILASFGFNHESDFVSFLIFLKLYELVGWITSLLANLLSRHFEYQAD